MPYELPALPYANDALEPHMDALTVQIHHDKHHAAYVNNLNAAVEKHPELFKKSLEDLVRDLEGVPEDIRTQVRNFGGGAYNHNVFWEILAPQAGGEPSGALAKEIAVSFGSFTDFKAAFEKAAMGRFGSGWAWLSKKADGGLVVSSTPNQDTPFAEGLYPILTIDVWEHAYYLKYQNRRADFVAAFWNMVNWNAVARRYEKGR